MDKQRREFMKDQIKNSINSFLDYICITLHICFYAANGQCGNHWNLVTIHIGK